MDGNLRHSQLLPTLQPFNSEIVYRVTTGIVFLGGVAKRRVESVDFKAKDNIQPGKILLSGTVTET